MSIAQTVNEILETLPLEKQQEVLDFVEFLHRKLSQTEKNSQSKRADVSVLEAAQQVLGVIGDGPSDLSTNKRYMEGYGQ